MNQRVSKWLKFTVRWGIAVAGIYYVVSSISLPDRVMIASPTDGWPVAVAVVQRASENEATFHVADPMGSSEPRIVSRDQLLVRPDQERVYIQQDGGRKKLEVLALQVTSDPDRSHWPLIATQPRTLWQRYWKIHQGPAMRIEPAQVLGTYQVTVPYPILEIGMARMVSEARGWLLWLAVFIFPTTFIITSIRWHRLLMALDICLTLSRTFVINMVGAFYNTFIPAGSTGGDLLKAWYAARQTVHRTRAVLSVLIDRIIGLLALIILGGTMAAYYYLTSDSRNDPAAIACRNVAMGSVGILGATALGLFVFFQSTIRRMLGLDLLLARLPMQKHVQHAIEVMAIYRKRPGLIAWALLITFPVHITVVVSTMLMCMAFQLHLSPAYYFVVVPVVVLVGAIPISPQGAGVMEFFAILLTRQQGATISQAFAMTMSIRLIQILWNLTGGIFVLRGGYHAPTAAEQKTLETDQPAVAPAPEAAT